MCQKLNEFCSKETFSKTSLALSCISFSLKQYVLVSDSTFVSRSLSRKSKRAFENVPLLNSSVLHFTELTDPSPRFYSCSCLQ